MTNTANDQAASLTCKIDALAVLSNPEARDAISSCFATVLGVVQSQAGKTVNHQSSPAEEFALEVLSNLLTSRLFATAVFQKCLPSTIYVLLAFNTMTPIRALLTNSAGWSLQRTQIVTLCSCTSVFQGFV